jgi:hypothetical protein
VGEAASAVMPFVPVVAAEAKKETARRRFAIVPTSL